MANTVSLGPRFQGDLSVLRSLGGPGSAVFLVSDDHTDVHELIGLCAGASWTPLVIHPSDVSGDHIHFPHETEVDIPLESLPEFLADRFRAGAPIHFLDAAAGFPEATEAAIHHVVSAGLRPWLIRLNSTAASPAGYTRIAAQDESSWFLADEHRHLKGALVGAVSRSTVETPPTALTRRLARRGKELVKARLHYLPSPLQKKIARRRHLRHVTAQQEHLTDPAFLSPVLTQPAQWIDPVGLPDVPPAGVEVSPMSDTDAQLVRRWLSETTLDTDELLDRRMDNQGDELGRAVAALRTRLALMKQSSEPDNAQGRKVLFDARSLQSRNFSQRGIGRFAAAALDAVRQAVPAEDLALLVDQGLDPLPANVLADLATITEVQTQQVLEFSVLVQPSPMTASAEPLVPILHSTAHKLAIVFDFIPLHYPSIYLKHPAARIEFAAAVDALLYYDEFVCISNTTAEELAALLQDHGIGIAGKSIATALPESIATDMRPRAASRSSQTGPIVVMTGDEPRKNTFGALAAVGVATAGSDSTRDIRVIGMAGQGSRVHHWAISAALREGEAQTVERLSDEEMEELIASASLVVVASFDEGLSLPVMEAVREGVPVVASDIPAHRELIGVGPYLAPAANLDAFARTIERNLTRKRTATEQQRLLANHSHRQLEQVVAAAIHRHRGQESSTPESVRPRARDRLSIGFATPWHPQPTGVADFSVATVKALAELADVTVYTTNDARVDDDLSHAPVSELLAGDPAHDVVVSVIGNSHFHLPFIELLAKRPCVAIAHDVRMVEFYMALRSKGGAAELMLRGSGGGFLSPSLDEQIDDMRLLQNAGMWEVARRSSTFITHSTMAAPRIAHETGVEPHVLPFANQRVPDAPDMTVALRRDARNRLGFDDELVHLATFGYVDTRTKQTDVVVEAAAWLQQWGHKVALHLVGAASTNDEKTLTKRAELAGIDSFNITGFVEEDVFRDYLLAIDVGIQLRISPLLGVSGPLSDLAAFGTPAVASRGLAIDVDTPNYVTRLPDDVSPVVVAEAVEATLAQSGSPDQRELERRAYLDRHSPKRYASMLLEILKESMKR